MDKNWMRTTKFWQSAPAFESNCICSPFQYSLQSLGKKAKWIDFFTRLYKICTTLQQSNPTTGDLGAEGDH